MLDWDVCSEVHPARAHPVPCLWRRWRESKNEEEESDGEEMRRITRVADSTHASSSCCGPPSPGRMVHWWKSEMVKWCKGEM